MTRQSPTTIFECTQTIDLNESSLEKVITDLQIKYKDTYDGIDAKFFLYSTSSKLALVKNFRDEAVGLLTDFTSEDVKGSPLAHLKEYSNTDQFKYWFKLSNLPMNPTAMSQENNQN